VTLTGNLATDVELRELGEDKRVASFLLAVNRPGPDGKADFVWITIWDRQAESCARYLAKGSRVAVDGRLRSRSWEDAEGKRHNAVEVRAGRVEFLDPPRNAGRAETPFEAAAA
jgi:single-strand DNA-binding protein